MQYVAPAFGFQKNFPYDDNDELEAMVGFDNNCTKFVLTLPVYMQISEAYSVCKQLSVSIGFHSGSGKSAKNYEICGSATEGHLEVKTSGRYTYEMGRALFQSQNKSDQKLWSDEIQSLTDAGIKNIDDAMAAKQEEIMQV